MQPATMTNDAKKTLKEKFLIGLARFTAEDLAKDPAVVDWLAGFKKQHMDALERDPRWLALPIEEKNKIVMAMENESAIDLVPFIEKQSDQFLWQMAQRQCMKVPSIGRMLQDPGSGTPEPISAPEKLKLAVQALFERVTADLHMMLALQRSVSAEEQAAGMAMTQFAMTLKKLTEFPFEKLDPKNADKLCRYLKGIFMLVCPLKE
jgi:hypothetical protein